MNHFAKNIEAKAIALTEVRDETLPVSAVLLVSLIIVVVLTGAGSLV